MSKSKRTDAKVRVSGTTAIGIVIGDGCPVSPSTVRRLIRDGHLKAEKLPGRTSAYRVDLDEIDRFRKSMLTSMQMVAQ